MNFLLVLLGTTAFCFIFKDLIRKAPIAFYAIGVALSVMYAVIGYVTYPFWLQQLLFLLMQKGTLATALFVVVMYMGVFKGVDVVKHRLMPTRATLSIVACLLVLGHVVKYVTAFLPRFGVLQGTVQVGLVVAIACFAIMIPLGVTSFKVVRKRMPATAWVALQKWAYVFYALVYVHIVALLLPSALRASGGGAAQTSIAIYSVVFGVYAVLRVAKALRDRA